MRLTLTFNEAEIVGTGGLFVNIPYSAKYGTGFIIQDSIFHSALTSFVLMGTITSWSAAIMNQ